MSLRTPRPFAWLPLFLLFLFIPIIHVVPLFVDFCCGNIIPGFLAPQGPEFFSPKLQPSLFCDVALLVVVMFSTVAP
jgi:hypothetical protein